MILIIKFMPILSIPYSFFKHKFNFSLIKSELNHKYDLYLNHLNLLNTLFKSVIDFSLPAKLSSEWPKFYPGRPN